jgi:hypothetical protein
VLLSTQQITTETVAYREDYRNSAGLARGRIQTGRQQSGSRPIRTKSFGSTLRKEETAKKNLNFQQFIRIRAIQRRDVGRKPL